MDNPLSCLLRPDSTSVLEDLLTFETYLNENAFLYFDGEVDHEKMIKGFRKDDRVYLDTLYKRSCAESAFYFKIANNRASRGDFLGATKALGEAKSFHMIAMENYHGNEALKKQYAKQQSKSAKNPRPDPLSDLIKKIVDKKPDITAKSLPDELEKYKGHGVIDDIDETEISYYVKGKEKESPISGLKDRLSRAKKNN
jgi:hypothetical protein